MRELKFRVWNGEQMISPDYIDRAGVAHWKENSIPQASAEVEQYTGLKGRGAKAVSRAYGTGKDPFSVPCDVEIYEGDIVDCHVAPCEGGEALDIRNAVVRYNGASLSIGGYSEWFCRNYIVHGNIHAMSELVGGK